MCLARLTVVLSLLLAGPAFAAPIAFDTSVPNGFRPQKSTDSSFGYLVSLTVAGKVMAADIPVMTPTGPGMAVGVLSQFQWAGGPGDAITLNAAISTANRTTLAALLRALPNTKVQAQFVVYQYDPDAKQWYPALQNVAVPLSAVIATNGRSFALAVGSTPNTEVVSPQNYALSITLLPGPAVQGIRVAFGVSANAVYVKPWGVTVQ